jgi:hypothetical protein
MPVEDVRWWEREVGRSLQHGQFGENLTTEGIDVNEALVGERWEVGTSVLEISEPRGLAGGSASGWTIGVSFVASRKCCALGHTCAQLRIRLPADA